MVVEAVVAAVVAIEAAAVVMMVVVEATVAAVAAVVVAEAMEAVEVVDMETGMTLVVAVVVAEVVAAGVEVTPEETAGVVMVDMVAAEAIGAKEVEVDMAVRASAMVANVSSLTGKEEAIAVAVEEWVLNKALDSLRVDHPQVLTALHSLSKMTPSPHMAESMRTSTRLRAQPKSISAI